MVGKPRKLQLKVSDAPNKKEIKHSGERLNLKKEVNDSNDAPLQHQQCKYNYLLAEERQVSHCRFKYIKKKMTTMSQQLKSFELLNK